MSVNYFRPSEFACQCGRQDCDAPTLVTASLLDPLNELRARVGRPLLITSGLRCAYWNQQQHGEPDSEHLIGEAADILAATSPERWSLLAANYASPVPLFARVGIGSTFLHFGASPHHAQRVVWTYYPKVTT